MQPKIVGEDIEYLRKHYAFMSNNELGRVLGVHKDTVRVYARKMGLHKSPDYLHELRSRVGKLSPTKGLTILTPEAIAKRTATRKARRQHDIVRISFGLEPLTNYPIRLEPHQKYWQRKYLQKLGYIIDKANAIAYYDENTHRATRIERIPRGKRKGSIKCYYDFKPITDKK